MRPSNIQLTSLIETLVEILVGI